MSKVKSITRINNQPVYNMTVEKYHNYLIQGGVVSKNCDALRYFCTWWVSPAAASEKNRVGKRWSADMLEDWDNASSEFREMMRELYGEPVR